MKVAASIALCALLSACGAAKPVRVETITVQVPTPVACIDAPLPAIPDMPKLTGQAQADALALGAALLRTMAALRETHAAATPCLRLAK